MSALLDFLTSQRADFRKARLASLYSDFRAQRTNNPDGYAANVAAWEGGLAAAAKAGVLADGTLVIQCGSQLEHELQTREYGLPQALGAVIEEGVIHGRMIPFSDFIQSPKSIYDRSWDLDLTQVPLKLASWVLKQAGLLSKASKDPAHRYVLVSNLENAGAILVKTLGTKARRVDRAIPIAEFRKEVASVLSVENVEELDLKVLLTFLHRDKHLIAYNDKAVKVKAATDSQPVLTPEDANICSLKSLIADIESQVVTITARIDQLQTKAREAVAKKSKTQAMAALRSKKLQEELLTKRSDTLGQLEGVFAKIEEAADQVEVVKAMEGSAQVLQNLTNEMGGIEKVEDVLDSLHEEMAKVGEIGTLMSEQGSAAAGINETEVDEELEQMEAEAKAEQGRLEAEATQKRLDELNIDKTLETSGRTAEEAPAEQPQRVADTA